MSDTQGLVAVKALGFTELARLLKDNARVFAPHLETAYGRMAALMAADARRRAPVLSGRLRGTVVGTVTKWGPNIEWGTPYGGPIHYGWPAHNISPQPFAQQAAEATQSQWLAEMVAGVNKALDQMARGAA